MHHLRWVLPLAACGNLSCGDPNLPREECTTGVLGDPMAEMDITLVALRADNVEEVLSPGSPLPLIFPPQGGRVAFVGVRAKNLDGCGVTLVGSVRDGKTGQVRLDGRTVNLNRTSEGFGATALPGQSLDSAISNYSNIPLCPNQWSDTNVYGTQYELTVSLKDRTGKRGTKTLRVVPTCGEPARLSECLCICRGGYMLGETCSRDAGAE